jgi:hypothetical protein
MVQEVTPGLLAIQLQIQAVCCAPVGKIENMHWQCSSPKGTLHCIVAIEIYYCPNKVFSQFWAIEKNQNKYYFIFPEKKTCRFGVQDSWNYQMSSSFFEFLQFFKGKNLERKVHPNVSS